MRNPITLGYSTCPNDTFIFYAAAHKRIDLEGLRFDIRLEDVETLNQWAENSVLQITKLSFAGLGHILDRYALLESGAALGRGCGPLIVAKTGLTPDTLRDARIAVPGIRTTANLLLGLFLGRPPKACPMRFDKVMPAVAGGDFDAGVVIHEGRFTYPDYGLTCIEDLGEWWESQTGLPIPLGGIAVKRDMGPDAAKTVANIIRRSVRFALENPTETEPYVRRYAGELAADVIQNHIGLYVNRFTENLGSEGVNAVETLFSRARSAGLLPDTKNSLFAES